jgi:hypothetical protein
MYHTGPLMTARALTNFQMLVVFRKVTATVTADGITFFVCLKQIYRPYIISLMKKLCWHFVWEVG